MIKYVKGVGHFDVSVIAFISEPRAIEDVKGECTNFDFEVLLNTGVSRNIFIYGYVDLPEWVDTENPSPYMTIAEAKALYNELVEAWRLVKEKRHAQD